MKKAENPDVWVNRCRLARLKRRVSGPVILHQSAINPSVVARTEQRPIPTPFTQTRRCCSPDPLTPAGRKETGAASHSNSSVTKCENPPNPGAEFQ